VPRQSILVVDDSPALRETVSVLLAGEYAVAAIVPAQLGDYSGSADLVIATPLLRERLPATLRRSAFLALGDAPAAALSRRFTPHQLRRQVASALRRPAAAAATASWRLRPPFLSSAAAAVVAEALGSSLPLHLRGEPGSGKRALARALHAAAGGGSLLRLDGGDPALRNLDLGGAQPSTLLVTAVDRLPARSQLDLLESIDAAQEVRPDALRVVTTATADLADLVERERFAHELFYRLSALVAFLPPLRERSAEIATIAATIADDIAERHRLQPVSFTPRARERLTNYLWAGNATELEMVLTRTLTLRGGGEIDAADIIFEGSSPPARRSALVAAAQVPLPGRNGKADLARNLDLIINELAHDFRNPLVTIKTFAQHCRRALREGADERRFAELTGEAVDQIDQSLENLQRFTRLGPAAAQPVALDALLAPILEHHRCALGERALQLAPPPPAAVAVLVDPDQTTYALDNLIRALTRGLAPGDSLDVQYCAPDALRLQLSPGARNVADQLSGLLDDNGSPPAAPLGIAIATAVLERNGVAMSVSELGTATTVMIRFPLAETVEVGVERNGTSSRAHR